MLGKASPFWKMWVVEAVRWIWGDLYPPGLAFNIPELPSAGNRGMPGLRPGGHRSPPVHRVSF